MNFAAVDCGTNSTRLLIADETGKRLVEQLKITRLGEGVHANRNLLPEAIRRTCDALHEFRELIEHHEVDAKRAVATSAVRDATNSEQFLEQASESLSAAVEVISGTEEAALTYAGATTTFGQDRWHLVIDIGGGSTELVLGRHAEVLFAESFDLGCVRLTEQFLRDDPPAASQLESARMSIEQAIGESQLLAVIKNHVPDLIAVAGTATSLATMDLGLELFDADAVHGHIMSLDSIDALHRTLVAQSTLQRTSSVMPAGRAEVIVGGTVILLSAMRMLSQRCCTVSTADLLTGLVFALVNKTE